MAGTRSRERVGFQGAHNDTMTRTRVLESVCELCLERAQRLDVRPLRGDHFLAHARALLQVLLQLALGALLLGLVLRGLRTASGRHGAAA